MNPSSDNNFAPAVGLLSPGWPVEANANGIVSYVASLAPALRAQGARCHVMAPRVSGAESPEVHKILADHSSLWSKLMYRLRPKSWPHEAFTRALLKELTALSRAGELDVFEMEESYGWARLLAGRCPATLVLRLHGPWFLNGSANGVPQDSEYLRRDAWEKQGLAAADAVTSPSRHVLEETRRHFGLPLNGAAVIPNPVAPVPQAERWSREACDPNRIAFVGRFDRHKGGDTMIDAFGQLLKTRPALTLDFVGPDRGVTDDACRSWNIEEYLSARLTPAERGRVVVHGFQPPSVASELRKKAAVTVAPSRYEAFGIAAAEAMAAGCPLVVSDAGALTELVQHDRNGLVFKAGDASDLAAKIAELLDAPERSARLGGQAARDAAERYAPNVVAAQTLDFYRHVLAGRPAARGSARRALELPELQTASV